MGRYKCACNCEDSGDSDVKFFKFPLYNPRKLRKWLANMKWKDWTPNRFSVLCVNHFEERYVDRTGKSVTLREDAVPTIFPSGDGPQKTKGSVNQRRKRRKPVANKVSESESAEAAAPTPVTANIGGQSEDPNHTDREQQRDREQRKSEKWRIIVDERLMKIDSFPHFFHGDYCVPQLKFQSRRVRHSSTEDVDSIMNIHWAPDDDLSAEGKHSENVIEVTEPWQWLALDVRGPLPGTLNGHRYVLTLADYFSRWVEAVPMQSCLPLHVASNVADVIGHFGYPLRILSRLPHDIVHKINRELKDLLKVSVALVVYHQQTGTADLITPQLIDRMVSDLTEEHAADWDVHLPARVFSLCFKEHPKTKERPFSVLCCSGVEPVQSPRELDSTYSKIQESVFVVR